MKIITWAKNRRTYVDKAKIYRNINIMTKRLNLSTTLKKDFMSKN